MHTTDSVHKIVLRSFVNGTLALVCKTNEYVTLKNRGDAVYIRIVVASVLDKLADVGLDGAGERFFIKQIIELFLDFFGIFNDSAYCRRDTVS